MKNKGLAKTAIASLLLASTSMANAALMLSLNDGSGSLVIGDNLAGDSDLRGGGISFIGTYGGIEFLISSGTGTELNTLPQLLHLDIFASNSAGSAESMTITLTDDGASGLGTFNYTIGGAGPIEINSFATAGGNVIGPVSQFGTAIANGLILPDPYTATLTASFTIAAGGTGSANMNLSVPEPSILALFGLGLLGMGVVGRRRKAS